MPHPSGGSTRALPLLSAFSQPAMACPLCGERCHCSYASGASTPGEHVAVLIDPDISENSEAQFEASLENASEMASRYRTIQLEAPVPKQRGAGGPPPISEEQWRSEVSSRVRRYRHRKGYDTSACLSLDFETAAEPPAHAVFDSPGAFMDIQFFADPKEHRPESREAAFSRHRAAVAEAPNVIEFPRQAAEELAEPVLDRPRILEAPAPVQLTLEDAPLAITLDPGPEPEPTYPALEVFEVPIQVAPLPLRAMAAGMDWLLVMFAAACFALVVARMVDAMPQGKSAFGLALLTIGIFWSLYQYLFLVYGTMTPGMQFAGLRLQRFDAERADCDQRRVRALSLVLSFASVGLGFAWAVVDEDTLCWHDRISRTYLSN